jgi:hypothetical protein
MPEKRHETDDQKRGERGGGGGGFATLRFSGTFSENASKTSRKYRRKRHENASVKHPFRIVHR